MTPHYIHLLMSVTNAISSVIIVGAIIAALSGNNEANIFNESSIFGYLLLFLQLVNIFGGFLLHKECWQCIKKKERINKCRHLLSAVFYSNFRCFIYSCFTGLSSPETSRQGNFFWDCWYDHCRNSYISIDW